MGGEHYRHIFLTNPPEENAFTATGTRGSKTIPERDRQAHSTFLQRELRRAWASAQDEQVVSHANRHGVYLEFKSEQGADLVTKPLEDMRSKKIRLLNIRTEIELVNNEVTGGEEEKVTTFATVFVANDKRAYFFEKIEQYATQNSPSGKPRNEDLINSIADIRKALLIDSFWQDSPELIPDDEPAWCEVWLSSNLEAVTHRFEVLLQQNQIQSKDGIVRFPERAIKVIRADRAQLELLTLLSDDIAEYRRAKETAAFWTDLQNREQVEWVEDLLQRSEVDSESNVSVCILDTGVNNGHPLLSQVLADEDCQSVDPSWGVHDHQRYGHGTLMAGVATYGNIMECLRDNDSVNLRHKIESVKIIPLPPNETEPNLWGYVTAQGVSRAEIQEPERLRTICIAVTASDTRDCGRPSSWSGTLDQLASGADDDYRRLLIVSAGNLMDFNRAAEYPESQINDSIQDPAQSWNALTVGGYTALDQIVDPTLSGYNPIAPKEGLSPFSTTSSNWDDKWPIKPEIVLEAGNMAVDQEGFVTECDDLSPLSTYFNPQEAHFYPFNMTSAATAQAAWLAAQIQATYPDFWPETIRALIVHSAEWSETLKTQFLRDETKTSYRKLLRICGYGVPSLDRAIYSASNSLTLIAQAELQPFDRRATGGFKTKDMHLYDLPWPKEALQGLPDDAEVKMRITLSYFIEPGPGEVGWKDRYRYASHILRFDLKSPGEPRVDFVRRINVAAREEEEGHPGTQSASDHWVIGSNSRDKGSVHSDIWKGTAAQLADSNVIAVVPRIGWWRERSHLGRWGRQTRYTLIVSISTTEEEVDIYTPVAAQVGITVPITVGA